MPYLDEHGLNTFWGGAQHEIIRRMTQTEYAALSDEEKRGPIMITDQYPEVFKAGMDIYSEEETVVGTYNGKPLYRKVVHGITPTRGDTWSTFARNAIGSVGIVDRMVSCAGMFYPTGGTCVPMPNKLTSTHWIGIYYDPSDDGIGIVCGSSYAVGAPGTVILEYTKTTDPEGSLTPLPVNYVHDYTTEDGWHVRKYSDGYVEMELEESYTNVSFNSFNGGQAATLRDTPRALPISLTKRFGYTASITKNTNSVGCFITLPSLTYDPLTQIPAIGLNTSYLGSVSSDNPTISISVTGRWK